MAYALVRRIRSTRQYLIVITTRVTSRRRERAGHDVPMLTMLMLLVAFAVEVGWLC